MAGEPDGAAAAWRRVDLFHGVTERTSPSRRARGAGVGERLSRAFGEFLAVPTAMTVASLVMAVLVDRLDNAAGDVGGWGPARKFLNQYAGDTQSAVTTLTAIAGSLITVASITFSILLLAVQQGAAALTSQMVDHYLRRRSNQVYFGFFTGASVYVLVTLVQTSRTPHPVLGVATSTLCAAASLFGLLLLIYSTIDQTRPVTLLKSIRDTTLAARERQTSWLSRTSALGDDREDGTPVLSDREGYLARLHLDDLERLVAATPGARVRVSRAVGERVSTGDVLARVAGLDPDARLAAAVRRALPVEDKRDITTDAAWGVNHLGSIGWTAISSVKSDPSLASLACEMLQNLLERWCGGAGERALAAPVSCPDGIMDQLMDEMEGLVVATAEFHQHQSLALLVDVLARSLDTMAAGEREDVARISRTVALALPSHLATRALTRSLAAFAAALARHGFDEPAEHLRTAHGRLLDNHL